LKTSIDWIIQGKMKGILPICIVNNAITFLYLINIEIPWIDAMKKAI